MHFELGKSCWLYFDFCLVFFIFFIPLDSRDHDVQFYLHLLFKVNEHIKPALVGDTDPNIGRSQEHGDTRGTWHEGGHMGICRSWPNSTFPPHVETFLR